MEHYRGILIGVFIALALIAPTALALRAFLKAFSGDSKKQPTHNTEAEPSEADGPGKENS